MRSRLTPVLLGLALVRCGQGGDVSRRASTIEAEDEQVEAMAQVEPEGEAAEGIEVPVRGVFIPDPPASEDRDGDGFVAAQDPDDDNPFAHPGAREIPCNGADEDGDTVDDCPADVDGDGVRATHDCDELDARIGPFMPEVSCDGIDQNCDGRDDCDGDDDGLDDADDPAPDDPAVGLPEEPPARFQ